MCEISGPFSAELITTVKNCSGAVGSGQALAEYWNSHDCIDAYSQVLNTTTIIDVPVLKYNPDYQTEVQVCVNELFNVYFETNTLTSDNPFNDTLLELCINDTLPGVCDKFLTSYCTGLGRPAVEGNADLTNFCGCYVPPNVLYLPYTNNPACDPLCHRALTSQKADHTTGIIERCEQNICVIDNVVVTGDANNIAGGINFSSVCGGCNNDNCLCIISGVNIADTLGNIGIGDNLSTFCSSNSVCLIEDANGNVISSGACPTNTNPTPTSTGPMPYWGVIIFLLILFLAIFFAVLAAYIAR